jgi:hypothetical protein
MGAFSKLRAENRAIRYNENAKAFSFRFYPLHGSSRKALCFK